MDGADLAAEGVVGAYHDAVERSCSIWSTVELVAGHDTIELVHAAHDTVEAVVAALACP